MRQALALLLLAPLPAAALTVTGWFQGSIASAENTYPHPGSPWPIEYFVDAPVAGSFRIQLDDDFSSRLPFDTLVPYLGTVELSLRIKDATFAFDGSGGYWWPDSSGESLEFRSDPRPRFDGFILGFESDRANLLQGPTPADYRVDGTTASDMRLYFAAAEVAGAFGVDVQRFGFGTLASPVPEAPLPLLMALGVAGVLAYQRRQARSASRRVASCTDTVSSSTVG